MGFPLILVVRGTHRRESCGRHSPRWDDSPEAFSELIHIFEAADVDEALRYAACIADDETIQLAREDPADDRIPGYAVAADSFAGTIDTGGGWSFLN